MELWLCLFLAAAQPVPVVGVLPPAPQRGADAWVGMSLADDLTARLLAHSRVDSAMMKRGYPLSVFGWRPTTAAARNEGVEATGPVSREDAARIARQLGADWLFVGAYTVEGETLALTWDVVGPAGGRSETLRGELPQLNTVAQKLFSAVLERVGEPVSAQMGAEPESLPLPSMKAYGEALHILRQQSLDPRARVVLPRSERVRAHLLLTAATDTAPRFARGWVQRGVVSSMLGESARAEEEFVRAMALVGEFAPFNALGLYYFYDQQGKHDEGIKVLEESTKTHPGFLQGMGYLGQAYLRQHRPREALGVFTTYHERAPRNPWVVTMRAQALAHLGQHDQAIAETQTLLSAFPTSLMVQSAMASRLIDGQHYDAARNLLEQALAHHADHPILLTRLSYIELEQNRPRAALELAEKAVRQVGDGRGHSLAGYAYANQGHALALLGRYDDAVAALQRAVALGLSAEARQRLVGDRRLGEFFKDPRCPVRPDAVTPTP